MLKLNCRKNISSRLTPGRRKFAWSFSRLVALFQLPDGTDLARLMMQQGHAVAYRQFSGTSHAPNAKRCRFRRY